MTKNNIKFLGFILLFIISSAFASVSIIPIPVNFVFNRLPFSLDNPIFSSVSLTLPATPFGIRGNPPSGTVFAGNSRNATFYYLDPGISSGKMTLNFTPQVGNNPFPAVSVPIVIINNVIQQPLHNNPVTIYSPNQLALCEYDVQAASGSQPATITITCGDA